MRGTATAPVETEYLPRFTSTEEDRLRVQARAIEEPTRALLDRLRLQPGMSVLDVGCGAGDVMELMAARVGPTGCVTGIDLNGALGRRTARRMRQSGKTPVEFIEGDLYDCDLAPGSFGVVFSRLVTLHLPDLDSALRRLWTWTRPGGRLGLMEFDFRTIDASPPTEAVQVLRRMVCSVLSSSGMDPHLGHTLPSRLSRAGIGDPDGVDANAALVPLRDWLPLLRQTFRGYLPHALRLGVLDEATADRCLRELEDSAERSGTYFLGPLLVTLWKTKPL